MPRNTSTTSALLSKRYTLLALGVAFFLFGVHVYLALTSANSFLNWFSFDDAFYYFKTAQNIVAGRGVTFDGTGPTNGFHPLWMLLLLPLFFLSHGDGLLALRLVLVLVGGLLGAAVGLFYFQGRRYFGATATLLVLLVGVLWPSRYLGIVTGGMESTLSVLTLVGFWASLAALEQAEREAKWQAVVPVGIAAALTMLARLDNALIVAVAGLLLLYRWLRLRISWPHRVRLALAYGLPGLLSVGGFLLWSRLVVGTWLPISSQVKTWWGSLANTPYGRSWRYRLLTVLQRFLETPLTQWSSIWEKYFTVSHYRMLFFQVVLAGVVAVVGLFVIGWKGKALYSRMQKTGLRLFLPGVVFHFVYMKLLSGISPLRDWYWTPEIVGLAVVAAWALGSKLRAWEQQKDKAQVLFVSIALVALGLGGHFARWVGHTYPRQNAHLHLYLYQAQWIEAHTEPGSVIGAAGSGSLGYFVQGRQVINLDGLISTPAYFHAMKAGQGVAYLQDRGLRYVFGSFWLTQFNPYRQVFADRLDTVDKCRYDGVEMTLYRFLP